MWFIKECSDEEYCWCVEIWEKINNEDKCVLPSGCINREDALKLIEKHNNEIIKIKENEKNS